MKKICEFYNLVSYLKQKGEKPNKNSKVIFKSNEKADCTKTIQKELQKYAIKILLKKIKIGKKVKYVTYKKYIIKKPPPKIGFFLYYIFKSMIPKT